MLKPLATTRISLTLHQLVNVEVRAKNHQVKIMDPIGNLLSFESEIVYFQVDGANVYAIQIRYKIS